MRTARRILVLMLAMVIGVSVMAQEKSKRKRIELTPMTQAMRNSFLQKRASPALNSSVEERGDRSVMGIAPDCPRIVLYPRGDSNTRPAV